MSDGTYYFIDQRVINIFNVSGEYIEREAEVLKKENYSKIETCNYVFLMF